MCGRHINYHHYHVNDKTIIYLSCVSTLGNSHMCALPEDLQTPQTSGNHQPTWLGFLTSSDASGSHFFSVGYHLFSLMIKMDVFKFQVDIQLSLSELSGSVICSVWFCLTSTWVPRSPSWSCAVSPCWGELRHDMYNLYTDGWQHSVGQEWGRAKEIGVSFIQASSVSLILSKPSEYSLSI